VKSKKVNILLSTYNGKKYIHEQIKSLYSQKNCEIQLLVRDDGSSDTTLSELQEIQLKNSEIITGKNIGVVKSFFYLLENSYNDSEYYAFCDQDDFWHEKKLSSAIFILEQQDELPAMYCSRLNIVDENLNFLHMSKIPKNLNFQNAIINNIVTGCTIVLNKKARDLLISKLPEKALMHDWWIYLVISSHGKIIYDETPHIDYRQHSNNVVGMQSSLKSFLLTLIKFFKNYNSNKLRVHTQIVEFKRLYADTLKKDDLNDLNDFLKSKSSFFKRLSFVIKGKIIRNSLSETITFSIQYLLGKY